MSTQKTRREKPVPFFPGNRASLLPPHIPKPHAPITHKRQIGAFAPDEHVVADWGEGGRFGEKGSGVEPFLCALRFFYVCVLAHPSPSPLYVNVASSLSPLNSTALSTVVGTAALGGMGGRETRGARDGGWRKKA